MIGLTIARGVVFYLLPVGATCLAIFLVRDYGYATLLLHLAIRLRKLSGWCINEAEKANKQQDKNKSNAKKVLLDMDDDYFVQIQGKMKEIG